MSAFQVSDVHINAIVQELVVRDIIGMAERLEVAKDFLHENMRALHDRYGDELPDIEDIEFEVEGVEAKLDPDTVLSLINCWRYQCSEGNVDEQRNCWLLADRLANLLCDEVNPDEYDGPWGITSWDEVILHA